MNDQVTYKQPRKFNIVVIGILIGLVIAIYLAWVYLPLYFRRSEVMRVLDETSSQFTGKSSRMMAEDALVDKMLNDMASQIRDLGVNDPQAEFWIEIDDDDNVRFGALYSDWLELPFTEKQEIVNEIEMLCTRPGRGSGWTCEGRELDQGQVGDDLPPVDPNAP